MTDCGNAASQTIINRGGIFYGLLRSDVDRQKVDFIANWLSGNIWGADWPFIRAILPWAAILFPFTLYKANRLNLLWLSEPVPIGIGVSVEKERAILLLTAVALAAAAVSVTGGIAFVGLRVPHFARALVGPRNQLFLPVAIQIRAWLHTIGRNILEPKGIPAGITISLIGAPYFMYLLTKSRRKSTIFVKAEDVFSFFCLPYHLQFSGAAKIGT